MKVSSSRPMRILGEYLKDFFNPHVAIMRFELKAKNMDEKLNRMNAAWNLLNDEIKIEE